MGIIALITALLPLVADLTPLLMQLIAQLRAQPGMTDEQILAHAKATGDENAVALVVEQLRLQAEIDATTKPLGGTE
jgi:hypothetical protein